MFTALTRLRDAPVGRAAVVAMAGVSLLAFTACGEDGSSASVSTVQIRPSSYVVKDPVTTTSLPPANEPDAEGRSQGVQTYIVASSTDYPYNIAQLFEIDLEELREFNGWEAGTFDGFPGVGGEVRIPPGAKFIDPTATTTTLSSTTVQDDDDDASEEAGGDRCNPTYVVESGDAPLVITRKFDITLDQLNAVNTNTQDWPNLYTGRTINLPPPADCTTAGATTTTAG